MKMPDEWLGETNQVHFIDKYRQRTAPVVLWGCVASLAGGELPEHSLVESKEEGHTTIWRILWVTATKVVHVDATKNRDDWNAYEEDEDAGIIDELDAWACPRNTINSVALTAADANRRRDYSEREKRWYWEATYRLTLNNNTQLSLPLFGEYRTDEHEATVTALVQHLLP